MSRAQQLIIIVGVVFGICIDRVYLYEKDLRYKAKEYDKIVTSMAEPLPMMGKK